MAHPKTMPPKTDRPIVYIREVPVDELPDEMQQQAKAAGLSTVYGIGRENGEQIALVRDRELAFMIARQNDLSPVSVH